MSAWISEIVSMTRDNFESEFTALDRERAIDIKEYARLTGRAVITCRQELARGEGAPFFRCGRSIRFRLGDVLDWRDARIVGKRAVKP